MLEVLKINDVNMGRISATKRKENKTNNFASISQCKNYYNKKTYSKLRKKHGALTLFNFVGYRRRIKERNNERIMGESPKTIHG